MKHLLNASRALCTAITLALSAAAAGAELDYGLLAGASYSDNVLRASSNEQSSAAAVVGFDLRGSRTTGRLLYDVFADVEYRDYTEDGVDSQEYGRLIALGSYAIVPERFEWLLSGSFDQMRESLLRPAAIGNLENVTTLSTGPRFTVTMDTFEVQTEAHYTLASYSERNFDSATAGGVLTLGRRVSERSYIGAGASYDDVTYDVPRGAIAPDYERSEYFVRLRTEGARTEFEADAGYTQISGDGFEDDGPMARARLTRRLTPFVSGFLGYTQVFSTSADATFTPTPSDGALFGDASTLSGGPREYSSSEVGLVMSRTRTTATLTYARRAESTVGPREDDRNYDELSASLTRLITTRSSFGVYGTYTDEQLEGVLVDPFGPPIDADASELMFGTNLQLALGRALSLEVRAEYRDRDSDVVGGSYKELSGGIFLRYGSARRQASQAAL